jgi:hypothetical protein
VHDTAVNAAVVVRLGVDWILHEVPFHTAASGSVLPSDSSKYEPTASQNVADVQDTWVRPAPSELAGTGNDCIVHALPFHVSAMLTLANGCW